MSLESNKEDFEKALAEMKESIELLDHSVDSAIMDTLNNVVGEYEGHLQGDIEDSETKIEDLESQIVDHDSIVKTFKSEISTLHDLIDNGA